MGAHRVRTGTPEDMAKLHPPLDRKPERVMELRFPLARLLGGLAQYANVCSLTRPSMSQMGIPRLALPCYFYIFCFIQVESVTDVQI